MRTDLFDFQLPGERIALRPINPRDAARLLVIRPGPPFEHRHVRELPHLLRPGDRLVLNDTKVIPARLNGRLLKGAEPKIEATLHRRLDGSRWRAFLKPAKKAAPGDVIRFGEEGKVCFLGQLDATVAEKGEGGEATLAALPPPGGGGRRANVTRPPRSGRKRSGRDLAPARRA